MPNIFVYTDNDKIIESLKHLSEYILTDYKITRVNNVENIEYSNNNNKVIIFHKEKESLEFYKLLRLPYLLEPVKLSYLNEKSNPKNSPPVIYIAYQDLLGLITEDLNYSLLECDNACKFINWFEDKENKVKELIKSFSVSPLDNTGKIKLKKLWKQIAQYNLQKFQDESNPSTRGHHAAKNILGPVNLLLTAGKANLINRLKVKWDIEEKKILAYEYLLKEETKESELTPTTENELTPFLKQREAKIYLIDDDAEDCGWNEALKYLFFESPDTVKIEGNSNETSYFDDHIKFSYTTSIDLTTNNSALDSIINTYDCLLLDLYFTDKDRHEPYGLQILTKIRELNKGFPVIVFTSSEKAENLKKVQQQNIVGYFMKGLSNYTVLVELIKSGIEQSYLTNLYILKEQLKKDLKPNLQKEIDDEMNKEKEIQELIEVKNKEKENKVQELKDTQELMKDCKNKIEDYRLKNSQLFDNLKYKDLRNEYVQQAKREEQNEINKQIEEENNFLSALMQDNNGLNTNIISIQQKIEELNKEIKLLEHSQKEKIIRQDSIKLLLDNEYIDHAFINTIFYHNQIFNNEVLSENNDNLLFINGIIVNLYKIIEHLRNVQDINQFKDLLNAIRAFYAHRNYLSGIISISFEDIIISWLVIFHYLCEYKSFNIDIKPILNKLIKDSQYSNIDINLKLIKLTISNTCTTIYPNFNSGNIVSSCKDIIKKAPVTDMEIHKFSLASIIIYLWTLIYYVENISKNNILNSILSAKINILMDAHDTIVGYIKKILLVKAI